MSLALNTGHDDNDLIAFCEGMACNTSIVALEVKLFVDVRELFKQAFTHFLRI